VLLALDTYRRGKGVKGSLTWTPVPQVVDALDAAFYLAFGAIEPSGARTLLALDVSGSMDGSYIAGTRISARVASAAMALVTAAIEPKHHIIGFSHQPVEVNISPRMRLDDVCRKLAQIPMGGTDCALPMLQARREKWDVDAFAVYTDNETWFGSVHPAQALRSYRELTSIKSKLAVVGMVSNEFTIADPNDAGMMDVVGFDAAAPAVLADFSAPSPPAVAR
jgi:60 kDa SS-A/Ro ribonucleoprotein